MAIALPRSVECLRNYSLPKLFADLLAGVTVGLVALPLAMAFAISSGVPPQAGLYCAVLAGFLISALGGSKAQIGGPTGAFVVVVYGIVAQHGLDGLFLCTIMAGGILLVLGMTGLGAAVKFIPRPVIIGFTNGIALLIASTQIKDFLGLQIDKIPGEFLGRMQALASHLDTASLPAILLAGSALVTVLGCQRFLKRVPGSILALLVGTVAAFAFHPPLETIGSRFGGIPSGLPTPHWPALDAGRFATLLSPALTVALLGAIESLMSAVVADRMSGDKHNPNMELVAQGVANIVAPLFGGLPATGAIARTATNIRSGAVSPVAGMIHALTLLAVLLFAAPLAQYIPLAVLSAILLVVAYNMGEWKEIPKILKLSWADVSVWLVTFVLTVFADLTLAVEIGMVLAALLAIRKVARTTTVTKVTKHAIEEGRMHMLQGQDIPAYVDLYRIDGPLLFGVTDKIAQLAELAEQLQPIVILRLRDMTAIDASGVLALEDLACKLHETGRTLILCGARHQPEKLLHKARFESHVIGRGNICPNISVALDRARKVFTHKLPLQKTA